MKLTLNILPPQPWLARPLFVMLGGVSLILMTLTALWVDDIIEMRDEIPRLEQRWIQLNRESGVSVPPEVLPSESDIASVRRRVSTLNTLSEVQGWNSSTLFSWLESALPDNVYLVSFHHRLKEGEILLVAESSGAEALTAFLLKLETEAHFAEVLLSKHGMSTGTDRGIVQFEIRIKERRP